MKQENLGVGLVLFLVYAFSGFLTETFQALLGVVAGAVALSGGVPVEEMAMESDLALESLMAGLTAAATMFGIVLVIRRSPSAPAFWSVVLALVAALHLLDALVRGTGVYSITLGALAACWQVYWMHSSNVERVFGTKGMGWS